MNCKCVSQINAKLAEKNLQLCVSYQIGPPMRDHFQIQTTFADARAKPRGSKPTPVLATFCPFCGALCHPEPTAPRPSSNPLPSLFPWWQPDFHSETYNEDFMYFESSQGVCGTAVLIRQREKKPALEIFIMKFPTPEKLALFIEQAKQEADQITVWMVGDSATVTQLAAAGFSPISTDRWAIHHLATCYFPHAIAVHDGLLWNASKPTATP